MNMADMEQGREINTLSLIEQLGLAFGELEARKEAFESKIQWVEIKQHFYDLEATLKKKLEELEAKEIECRQKELEMHTLLAKRKAAVASKEQDLLNRVQELKDAAVAAIAEARANHQTAALESVDDGESRDNQVSSFLRDKNPPEEDFPQIRGKF